MKIVPCPHCSKKLGVAFRRKKRGESLTLSALILLALPLTCERCHALFIPRKLARRSINRFCSIACSRPRINRWPEGDPRK